MNDGIGIPRPRHVGLVPDTLIFHPMPSGSETVIVSFDAKGGDQGALPLLPPARARARREQAARPRPRHPHRTGARLAAASFASGGRARAAHPSGSPIGAWIGVERAPVDRPGPIAPCRAGGPTSAGGPWGCASAGSGCEPSDQAPSPPRRLSRIRFALRSRRFERWRSFLAFARLALRKHHYI